MKRSAIPIANAKSELKRINYWLQKPQLLIGGLAVQQYVVTRNSADIDLVCDYELATDLIKALYPSNEWKVEDVNRDEYHPAYKIYPLTPQVGLNKIEIGPKIIERESYDHLEWEDLRAHARPFVYKNDILKNILIPSSAALAYSKVVSFLGRAKHQLEKREQDLDDFVELSNHESFDMHEFVFLVGSGDLRDEVRDNFLIETDKQQSIVSRSIHFNVWIDFFRTAASGNRSNEALLVGGDYVSREARGGKEEQSDLSLINHALNKVSIIRELLDVIQSKDVKVCPPEDLVGKTIFESLPLFEPLNPELERGSILNTLIEARRCAFDKKYGEGVDDDERFDDIERWRKEFIKVLDFVGLEDLDDLRVINVGSGLGYEGKEIYDRFNTIIAVDISQRALKAFEGNFPLSKTLFTDAENLAFVEGESVDLYLALRVYTSTLFDMRRALHEARRVLVPGGKCIVSTPIKYLVEGRLVDGLARPGLSYDKPDRNYAFEIVEDIRQVFWREGFDDLRIVCSFTEAFVIGTKPDL